MPREAPNLPRDTHARLLAGRGANGHMPVVGHEVATFPRRSLARWRIRRLAGAVARCIRCSRGRGALRGIAARALVLG